MQARWIAGNVDRIFGAENRATVERLVTMVCGGHGEPDRDIHALSLEGFCALAELGNQRQVGNFALAMGIAHRRGADGTQREVLAYRFEVDNTVLAFRNFMSAPRESMLRFVREIESLGLQLPSDMAQSYCFNDARLINRLVDASPNEIALYSNAQLDELAADIDELNTVPDYSYKPAIAMAAKAMLLADYYPEQRFDIHFRREMGVEDDGYFLCVRPKIDQGIAIASPPVELYAGEMSPGDAREVLSLLLLAIRLRVSNELEEHHVSIDSRTALIAKHRDAMTQDPSTRRILVERSDDPLFHSGNYRFLGADANEGIFSVAFNDQVMVFSNAPSTMRELRGERLQMLLKHGHYRNLDELMATGHRTAADPILRAAMSTLQNDVLPMMMLLNEDGLSILRKEIDAIPVADTTLGALWDPMGPETVAKARADRAAANSRANHAAKAALRASLRLDAFAAPFYGLRLAEEDVKPEGAEENPAPEGISQAIFNRFPGHHNWV